MYEQDVKESQGVLWKHRDLRSKKISVTNTPKDSSEVEDLKIIKLEIMLQNIKKNRNAPAGDGMLTKPLKWCLTSGSLHMYLTHG